MKLPMRYLYTVTVLLPLVGCQASGPSRSQAMPAHSDGPSHHRSAAADGSIKNSAQYLDDHTPVASAQVTLTVHGLGCPLCAGNVDKQLLRVPGVENIKVNLNDGTAVLRVNPASPPTRSQLANAIFESGFTLVNIKD